MIADNANEIFIPSSWILVLKFSILMCTLMQEATEKYLWNWKRFSQKHYPFFTFHEHRFVKPLQMSSCLGCKCRCDFLRMGRKFLAGTISDKARASRLRKIHKYLHPPVCVFEWTKLGMSTDSWYQRSNAILGMHSLLSRKKMSHLYFALIHSIELVFSNCDYIAFS